MAAYVYKATGAVVESPRALDPAFYEPVASKAESKSGSRSKAKTAKKKTEKSKE